MSECDTGRDTHCSTNEAVKSTGSSMAEKLPREPTHEQHVDQSTLDTRKFGSTALTVRVPMASISHLHYPFDK